MKALKFASLFLMAMTGVVVLHAQTVDEIINKYIDAIGGKDKLNSMKTVYVESSVEVMGNEAPSTTYIIFGKGLKSETDFGGQKIIQCVTDHGGWMINPMMGQTSAQELPADQLKGSAAQFTAGGVLLDYAAKGSKAELQGKEDVNGVSAYKILVTTKDSAVQTYYIDPTTYYILKTVTTVVANGQSVETTVTFSNYQKTDFGYVVPMVQQISLPQGFTVNITNKKVEVNKDIDPKIFDMPKS
ncbi:MAG TPA: hypothetical protein VMH01_03205 [Puia sp.]|nr:hypothetical protein [Puia sp.]